MIIILRKIVSIATVFVLITIQTSLADCNPKTDIVKKGNSYIYSLDCHKMVGRLIKNEKDLKEQIKHLDKSISLKDLALDTADKRIMNWRKEAYNQYNILQKYSRFRKYDKYIWFGSGVAVVILSVWAAGKIYQ